MGRNSYSAGKRQREATKARKKRDKGMRRRRNKDSDQLGEGEIRIATTDELQGGLRTAEEVIDDLAGGGGNRAAPGIPSRLFVGGLSWRTDVKDLRAAFEKYGGVSDAVVVTDRDTGDSRGFGFVTMSDRRDAVIAIKKLNGQDLDGRMLVVKQATER